ncbi:hypothetical protein FQR65_LT04196 [Abscondita terminalis]|nr:hypothetical protein FQR65_LT04196 [Abscondita terminalis]
MIHSSDNIDRMPQLLNELTSIQLNDRIVTLSAFLCKMCDNFLFPPIRLVESVGNICGKCELQDKSKTILDNTEMETVLQNFAIPCPNKSKGCKEYLDYYNVETHMSACPTTYYKCPYNTLENCNWEGALSSIFMHCSNTHPENVLQPTNHTLLIAVDTKKTGNAVSLIVIDNDKFIVHIKCDVQTSSFYCTMYYMGDLNRLDNFTFIVEPIEKRFNSYSLQYEFHKMVPYNTNFSLDVDPVNALIIDLDRLQQFGGSVIKTIFKIIPNDTEDIDETLLNVFECPVCKNYMKPPIFQCSKGHSICNFCKSKLVCCPICRLSIKDARNYSLETLCDRIKFPCLHKEFGCRIVMSASNITIHEIECSWKPYRCPFFEANKCFWNGPLFNVVNHLTLEHNQKTNISNTLKICYHYECDNSTSDFNCVIYNECIFKVCHKYDNNSRNISWSVQYVGPNDDAKKYKYEIVVLDYSNQYKKFMRGDVCQSLTDYDGKCEQGVTFPLNSLTMFSTDEAIPYLCKIDKIHL